MKQLCCGIVTRKKNQSSEIATQERIDEIPVRSGPVRSGPVRCAILTIFLLFFFPDFFFKTRLCSLNFLVSSGMYFNMFNTILCPVATHLLSFYKIVGGSRLFVLGLRTHKLYIANYLF